MNTQQVLDIFKTITAIPRESGHEEPVTNWLEQWADDHGFPCKRDSIGNILIVREAAEGKENVPTVVLQAHQDMVCEKLSSSNHDFLKDPISYIIKDGWMIAPETTLGADDGIGIAAALALLLDEAPTGRIECLFTISEETGMDGAEALKEGFFTGRTLINLDSEDEGQLFIGCAGGCNTRIEFKLGRAAASVGSSCVKLNIFNAIGGHSGDDINKDRANTVQLMSRFIYGELGAGLRLVSYDGGGKSNAIARECEAVVSTADPDGVVARFSEFGLTLREEFHVTDPDISCSASICADDKAPVTEEDTRRLISSLFTCPHGVQSMSQDIPGLVQTSTNLASVKMPQEDIAVVTTSQRSSAVSERSAIAAKVRANFEFAGADVKQLYFYPGWNPNVNSSILKVCVESYRKLFGKEAEVKAIHAGLECGLFLEKFPGLDMISFGPTLRGVHAPGERMDLDSLDRFVLLLDDVVKSVS